MSQKFRTLELQKEYSPLETILWSGLVAGILDGLAGIIVYYFWFGFTPVKVFQFVASGLYGKAAYSGGIPIAVIGFLLHFLIGYVSAVIYFYAFPKIRILRTRKFLSGIIYGLLVFLFMNVIIMPLSKVIEGPLDVKLTIIRIVWHMFCVGLPISLITAKYYASKW